MSYIAAFILAFAFVRLLVVLANAGQWIKSRRTNDRPGVSVLIPARNEENNIGTLLSHLSQLHYENLEIIIYNDNSEDATLEVIESFAEHDSRIKVLNGHDLPAGWRGKNHACHRLAEQAKGEFLLFLDADVQVKGSIIESAVASIEKYNIDLLSIFPLQLMQTKAEKIIVPIMNWILVSLLPLAMVRLTRNPSFAAANGQFMMFRAEVYRKEMFHSRLRNRPVEDIAIARFMKEKGYRVQTLLGNEEISCRMYDNGRDAIGGFSRSTPQFFGGSHILAILFALITTFGFIPVGLAFSLPVTIAYFGMIILMRTLISVWSRQNITDNLLLAPVQQIAFLYIVFHSVLHRHKKSLKWKGRLIYQ
jgi:glycosyltransferase involved in cell wall biosynthesis